MNENIHINNNNKVYIQILTPVHIGGGSEKNWIEGIDYIFDRNKVYIVNQTKLFSKLNESDINILSNIISSGENEKFKKYIIDKKLTFQDISSIDFDCKLKPKDDIKTFIRTGLGTPIIPGSSLKGAIKSSMFNYLFNLSKPTLSDKQKITQPITDRKLSNRNLDEELFGKINNNLMRYLRITDAEFEKTDLFVTKTFNLKNNGNWVAAWKYNKGSGNNQVKFSPDGFAFTYEVLPVNAYSILRIGFADGILKNIDSRDKPLNADKLFNKEDPLKILFNIINDYTYNYIKKECEFFKKYSNSETSSIIDKLNEIDEHIDDNNNSCVLRMAGGSGFHSITGDWQFNTHIETINNQDKKYKSRKLAIDTIDNDGYSFYPMGFVKLYTEEEWNKQKGKLDEVKKQKKELRKQQEEKEKIVFEKKEEEQRKAEEARKPVTRKFEDLIDGSVIDAEVIGQEELQVIVNLFADGLKDKKAKFRYASGFPVGTILTLNITFPNKKNRSFFNLINPKVKC